MTTQRFAVEEYRALRNTIHWRSTTRIALAVFTIVAWATLVRTAPESRLGPLASIISLFVMTTGFEGVFALHVGVERIGRYLQVYLETGVDTAPAWEHAAMAFGRANSLNPRIDPLFSWPFVMAMVVNLAASLVPHRPVAMAGLTLAHLAAILRVLTARRYAARQRDADLLTFQRLKASTSTHAE